MMNWFLYLSTAIEAAAGILISVAALRSLDSSIPLFFLRAYESARKQDIRLELGLWLSLALEISFQPCRWQSVYLFTGSFFFHSGETDGTHARPELL
jgi:hypothetical protein